MDHFVEIGVVSLKGLNSAIFIFSNSFHIFFAFFLIVNNRLLVCLYFLLVLFFELGQLLIEKKVQFFSLQQFFAELLVFPGQCMDVIVFLLINLLIDGNLQFFLCQLFVSLSKLLFDVFEPFSKDAYLILQIRNNNLFGCFLRLSIKN